MKILHTSDWHIGKRLPPMSREEEQRQVLKEICEAARRERADVTVIAGDVFDVSMPSSEAEEIFFSAALELSRTCLVVAVAGNHDDGERLSAVRDIAARSNILLVGGFDCGGLRAEGVEAKKHGFVYRKGEERLNMLTVPYITESRRGDPPAPDFAAYVKEILAEGAAEVFGEGCNMLIGHLFMLGACAGEEERELGTAKLLPLSVLPECDYAALGHIHKPMALKENVRYSGSILNYSFADTAGKQVLIYDTESRQTKSVPLTGGRRLLTVKAGDFPSALAAVTENGDCYVRLIYESAQPLTVSQTSQLERAGRLAELTVVTQAPKREAERRAHRSPQQLLEQFYASLYGAPPDEDLIGEFNALMEEGE